MELQGPGTATGKIILLTKNQNLRVTLSREFYRQGGLFFRFFVPKNQLPCRSSKNSCVWVTFKNLISLKFTSLNLTCAPGVNLILIRDRNVDKMTSFCDIKSNKKSNKSSHTFKNWNAAKEIRIVLITSNSHKSFGSFEVKFRLNLHKIRLNSEYWADGSKNFLSYSYFGSMPRIASGCGSVGQKYARESRVTFEKNCSIKIKVSKSSRFCQNCIVL